MRQKVATGWSGLGSQGQAREIKITEESGGETENNLSQYVQNAGGILRYVLETLRENGFEQGDKQKTVELIRVALGYQDTHKYFRSAQMGMEEREAKVRDFSQTDIDLNLIFEYFSDEHYLMRTSIIQLMQHRFMSMDDPLFTPTSFNEQISPEVLIEKVTFLVVCLYAMSTENRFIENKDQQAQSRESVVHKETSEITLRFQNFDLAAKTLDLSEEELRRMQRTKLLRRQQQVNQRVTRS